VKAVSHWGAVVGILFVTGIWGSSFSVVQYSLRAGLDVTSLLAIRFVLGAFGLAVILAVTRTRPIWPALRDGLVLGVVVTGGFWFQADGLHFTTVPKSSFITGLFVVFTPLVALFFGERIKPHHALAAGVSVIGLYALTRDPTASSGGWNRGDVETLFSAMLFGIQVYLIARFSRRSNPLVVAFGQAAGTGVLSTLLLLAWPGLAMPAPNFVWTPGLIIAVCFLALVATALVSGVQCTMQAKLGATEAAIFFTLEPLFATLIAVFGLVPGIQVHLSAMQWLGALILLTAPVLAERGGRFFSARRSA
jgi:drug/metabolite transporter (DMT)-like permease